MSSTCKPFRDQQFCDNIFHRLFTIVLDNECVFVIIKFVKIYFIEYFTDVLNIDLFLLFRYGEGPDALVPSMHGHFRFVKGTLDNPEVCFEFCIGYDAISPVRVFFLELGGLCMLSSPCFK